MSTFQDFIASMMAALKRWTASSPTSEPSQPSKASATTSASGLTKSSASFILPPPTDAVPGPWKTSLRGDQVLTDREACILEAYWDTEGKVWTIGVGHTSAAGPPEVVKGMTITHDQALQILAADLIKWEKVIDNAVKVPLRQNEFDAIISFVHNVGETQFHGSTFLHRLNQGDRKGALEALLWYNRPPSIIPRRNGEYVQFRDGTYLARVATIPPPRTS